MSITQPPSERLARLALATVMIGAFMSLLDTTIVNVALPSMARGLAASHSALEWIVSGYALAFGLVLIPAGRLGDAIGRRPVYIAGLVAFLLASLGAGVSQTAGELVAARIVQGVAAGTYYTQINATIVDMFAGRERGRAFGVLSAVIGLSTAVGPLAGGLLISAGGPHSGWRWIFLVNLAIGLVAVPAAARFLPAPVRGARQHADLAGLGQRADQEDPLSRQDLMRALGELPEDQRSVLLLVAVEDLPYAETARILGVPIGTVMSRLSRAREKLRLSMGEEAPPALRRVK